MALDRLQRAVVTVTAAALVVLLPGVPAPLRAVAAVAFFCAGPGLAWIRFLPLDGAVEQAGVAMALSLALDVVVAEVLLFAGLPGVVPASVVLAGIALAGVGVGRRRVPA